MTRNSSWLGGVLVAMLAAGLPPEAVRAQTGGPATRPVPGTIVLAAVLPGDGAVLAAGAGSAARFDLAPIAETRRDPAVMGGVERLVLRLVNWLIAGVLAAVGVVLAFVLAVRCPFV